MSWGFYEQGAKEDFLKWYILFYESDENIHHGNQSAVPIVQNTLFALFYHRILKLAAVYYRSTGSYLDQKGLK